MKENLCLIKDILIVFFLSGQFVYAQKNLHSEQLHTAQPDYPTPYSLPKNEEIKAVLDRILIYLEGNTPTRIINKNSRETIQDFPTTTDSNLTVERGTFSLTSYEWGVTYAGMLAVGNQTGDNRYTKYTQDRFDFLNRCVPYFIKMKELYPTLKVLPLRQIIEPKALDDCGAMAAAMIRATNLGMSTNLKPLIDNYLQHISKGQYRFPDGTLARNRPQNSTLWLDDLFMAVPALAQMGKFSGDNKYFDDAANQVLQYQKRMFNGQKNVYMHGWVQTMSDHPEFYWARANGWAVMALVELLDVLPENHKNYPELLKLLQIHIKGLASYQDGTGFWHQLLDKSDSYLETSATAIYAYSMARAINRGWINPMAYGPKVLLARNAVASKVNIQGQVEGVCVGTGMGFDPAFYYYRPTNVYAAHGYGPTLLAGAEMIALIKNGKFSYNDSAIQYNKN